MTHADADVAQHDLCSALQASGVETMRLVDNDSGSTLTRFLHDQLRGASARLTGTPVLGESANWLGSLPGRRASRRDDTTLLTSAPENAFPDIAIRFHPTLVLGTGIATSAWAAVRDTCKDLDISTGIYLSTEDSLRHLLSRSGGESLRHDLVLADSTALAASARAFRVDAKYLPAVVDLDSAEVNSTLERVLCIDPRSTCELERVAVLADHFRTIEFVLQESAPLSRHEARNVDALLAQHPNVCFRPEPATRAEMYHDAGILLFPSRVDCSPRTIRESLSNGIPVLGTNLPGIAEAIGPGGLVASSPQEWFDGINRMWRDPEAYRHYRTRGRVHARRQEVETDEIIGRLITYIQDAVAARSDRIIDLG